MAQNLQSFLVLGLLSETGLEECFVSSFNVCFVSSFSVASSMLSTCSPTRGRVAEGSSDRSEVCARASDMVTDDPF